MLLAVLNGGMCAVTGFLSRLLLYVLLMLITPTQCKMA